MPLRTCFRAFLILAAGGALAGCAKVHDVTMRVMASPSYALAVVRDTPLSGTAMLYTDRTGTLELAGRGDRPLQCMGTMRYTGTTGGAVNLRCSDGTQAQMNFTALTETTGHGRGRLPDGMASFTYGLEADSARAWLVPPAGRQIVADGDRVKLE